MNEQPQDRRDYRFLIGLLAGTAIGAGLTMWFAPRAASELRERVTDSAKRLGTRASGQYQRAANAVGEAADELTLKGQGIRDNVATAVAAGAAHRKRQRAQPPVRDLALALETGAVLAGVEPDERLVETDQRLRPHLEQRQRDVALHVRVGMLDVVSTLAQPVGAPLADASLDLVLQLAAALGEEQLQVCASCGGVSHVRTPPDSMPERSSPVGAGVNTSAEAAWVR